MRKFIFATISSLVILLMLPFYRLTPINAEAGENYITFNGGTIGVIIQNAPVPQSFAFEASIRPTSVSGQRQLLTITDANNINNYQVGINGGSLSLYYRFATSSSRALVSGNIKINTWQKIKVTIDANATRMYINDVLISSASGATALKKLGNKITAGSNYAGDMDNFSITKDQAQYILWNFDQARSETNAVDSSANHFNGTLNGGDFKIHYFGIVPTTSRFVLPTLPSIFRITPFPLPTSQVAPTGINPQPTFGIGLNWYRTDRPQYPR